MGNRRFAQVSTSDDEEDDDAIPIRQRILKKRFEEPEKNQSQRKKRKMTKLREDDDDDEEFNEADEEELEEEEEDEEEEEAIDMEIEEEEDSEDEKKKRMRKTKKKKMKDEEEEEEEKVDEEAEGSKSEDEEDDSVDARPVGDPIKVAGKGKSRKSHYEAFEYDGNQYDLEDPVLITPESSSEMQKPYVAIIKEITQDKDGNVMMTGQWFYRPEEAAKKGGGNWQSSDSRELFYSFHRDEVPAESVMHRCVVHFVPIHKQLPNRKQYPGFIVRKVYDTVEKKLWKLTDKDYEDKKQQEIDVLVQKTMKRMVDLPDIEPEENVTVADQEDHLKSKRILRRKNISPLDVSRDEERSEQTPKAETPGSCLSNTSEYYGALVKSNVLTGDTHRDKWLERLLQAIQYVCSSANGTYKDDKEKAYGNGIKQESGLTASEVTKGSEDKSLKDSQGLGWPDAAVPAVAALEKASHESLTSDFQKYNQKLRQLAFNLKNNALLARRLLNGELKPSKILNMSPTELKEGLTVEETARKEPDESERMQMTGVRCSRCNELKVGVRDIIQAGHGERYQLECIACGHSWYGSRDDAATLTIDAPRIKDVGAAPLATTKFEAIEKKLVSPRDSDNKLTEAFMPVLETQKSFPKPKKDETSEPAPKTPAANPEPSPNA